MRQRLIRAEVNKQRSEPKPLNFESEKLSQQSTIRELGLLFRDLNKSSTRILSRKNLNLAALHPNERRILGPILAKFENPRYTIDMDGFVVKALSLWEGARYEDRVGALGRKARWPVAKPRRELTDLKELEVVPEDEESLSVRSFRRNDLIARNISKGGVLVLERMM